MHEWALANEIIKSAEKEAKDRKAKCIVEVNLEIGELNNIVYDQLVYSFEIAKKNTLLAESKLNIKSIKAIGFCKVCEKSFEIEAPFIFCPICGGIDVKIEKGEEMNITKMVVEF